MVNSGGTQQRARAHLEASRRVVDAGVDDLAVTGTGAGAEAGGRLDHDHLAPGHRQRPRRREADDARAHHHGVRRLPRRPRGPRREASTSEAPRAGGPRQAPHQDHAPLAARSFVWLVERAWRPRAARTGSLLSTPRGRGAAISRSFGLENGTGARAHGTHACAARVRKTQPHMESRKG